MAARWDASSNPALWLKAAKLEPGNAEYWRHVGLLRQWDMNPSDMREAVHYLQIATKVNSRSSGVWMDLADAYATAGEGMRARKHTTERCIAFPCRLKLPGDMEISAVSGELLRSLSEDSKGHCNRSIFDTKRAGGVLAVESGRDADRERPVT